MSELSVGAKRTKGGVAWDVDSPHPTPPGTPPPPYGSTNIAHEELSELLPDDADSAGVEVSYHYFLMVSNTSKHSFGLCNFYLFMILFVFFMFH